MAELSFNKLLEILEALKNFGFVTQEINPRELTIIINKAHIVIIVANRGWCRTPNIRGNKF